jgi:hypothetical protein
MTQYCAHRSQRADLSCSGQGQQGRLDQDANAYLDELLNLELTQLHSKYCIQRTALVP